MAVALGLELPAAAAGPAVTEYRPGQGGRSADFDLSDLAVAWRRITTWKNTESSGGSGTWNKVSL